MESIFKRISTVLLAVVVCMMSLPLPVVAEVEVNPSNNKAESLEECVEIPDIKLRKVILLELANLGVQGAESEEYTITKDDMARITSIEMTPEFGKPLDLTGMEWAVNLEKISINGYRISDLTPIESLKKLRVVHLMNNYLNNESIPSLAKLPPLKELRIGSNDFTDISGLKDLIVVSGDFDCLNNSVRIKPEGSPFDFVALDKEGKPCKIDHVHGGSIGYVSIEGTTITVLKPSPTILDLTYTSEDGKFGGTLKLDIKEAVIQVDRAKLQEALQNYDSLEPAVKMSADGTDVDVSETWVTEAAQIALDDAVRAAKEVVVKEGATQDEINRAVDALNEAMKDYEPQDGRRKVVKETRVETVPFESKTVKDDENYADYKEVTQEGQDGKCTVVEEVTYVDDEVQSREIISKNLTKKPVDEVVTVGTKPVITVKVETRTEKIPFETKKIEDKTLEKGKVLVKQEGQDGEKSIEEKVTFTKGVESGRKLVTEKVLKAPVPKVVHIGVKERHQITFPSTAKPSGSDSEHREETSKTEEERTEKFTDIQDHWAEPVIHAVVKEGYFKGTGETTFEPNRSITRGEFVTVLGRMEEVKVKDYASSALKDVEAGSYYEGYVNWAVEQGVVQGYDDGTFGPERAITREEMAMTLHRLLDRQGKLTSNAEAMRYVDEHHINPWAKEAIVALSQHGVIQGREDGQFAPREALTRGEVAQLIYNLKIK